MAVCGEEVATTSILELSPGIGYYNFDADRHLENKPMAAMGFGMHLSRRWAVLLDYSRLKTTRTEGGVRMGVDVKKYHLDVYRFFNTERRLRPYVVAGIGVMDLDSDDDVRNENEDLLNAGLGLYYRITPNWSVRGDWRIFDAYSDKYNDDALTVTLGYRLKEGESGD
jgi:opacity protein-like surface antigen